MLGDWWRVLRSAVAALISYSLLQLKYGSSRCLEHQMPSVLLRKILSYLTVQASHYYFQDLKAAMADTTPAIAATIPNTVRQLLLARRSKLIPKVTGKKIYSDSKLHRALWRAIAVHSRTFIRCPNLLDLCFEINTLGRRASGRWREGNARWWIAE